MWGDSSNTHQFTNNCDRKTWHWFTTKLICARYYLKINQAASSVVHLLGSSSSRPPVVFELCSCLFVRGPRRVFSPVLDSPPSPRLHWAWSSAYWEMLAVRKSGPDRGKEQADMRLRIIQTWVTTISVFLLSPSSQSQCFCWMWSCFSTCTQIQDGQSLG